MRSLVLLTAAFFTLLVASPLVGNTGFTISPDCEKNLPSGFSCFQSGKIRFYLQKEQTVLEVFNGIKLLLTKIPLDRETTVFMIKANTTGQVIFHLRGSADGKGFISWWDKSMRIVSPELRVDSGVGEKTEDMIRRIKVALFTGSLSPFMTTSNSSKV